MPVVVELFTSQDRSNCPPADALLRQVKATDPDILSLDLHVTYWGDVARKAPFSLRAATEVQAHYAPLGDSTQVYTPEAAIEGKAQFVAALPQTLAPSPVQPALRDDTS